MAGGAGWAGAPAALLRSVRRLREVFEVCGRDPDGFLRVERVAALGLRFGQGEEVRAPRRAAPRRVPGPRQRPCPLRAQEGPRRRQPLTPPEGVPRTPAPPNPWPRWDPRSPPQGGLPAHLPSPAVRVLLMGVRTHPMFGGAGAVRTRPPGRPGSLGTEFQDAGWGLERAPRWASARGWRGQLGAPTPHREG